MAKRVLAIGLDGFEITLAERLVAEGLMPNFAAVGSRGVRYQLEHGADKYSGLAWEHVSAGRAPSDGARWSAVTFDKEYYTARQESTSSRPFFADLPLRSVVFDLPYCDLSAAPSVTGITKWGAHDPGVGAASRPDGLHLEIAQRFGRYPAAEWIYGFTWPSVERTVRSSAALTKAVHVRAEAARWLLAERLPDWDLGIVVVSETHSAIEPLWHGVNDQHPLHVLPSAKPAGEGLLAVYKPVDDLIGTLTLAFPDAVVVLFAMHGMGTNEADVSTMVLLPELLHRHAFGRPHMRPWQWPAQLTDGTPLVSESDTWEEAVARVVPLVSEPARSGFRRWRDRLTGRHSVSRYVPDEDLGAMSWMPATRYRPFWSQMAVFALPSFYDARIRLNLRGREAAGMVESSQYRSTLEATGQLLRDCRDTISGREIVADIQMHEGDPALVGPSEADMTVIWRGTSLGMDHPRLGRIGPVPWRRTGGHTGEHGFLYVAGWAARPCDAGVASSFDVVPTLISLAGAQRPEWLSGRVLPALSSAMDGGT